MPPTNKMQYKVPPRTDISVSRSTIEYFYCLLESSLALYLYKSSSSYSKEAIYMYYNNFTSKTSSRGNYQNLPEADNLSTTDKVPAPNVSVVRRFPDCRVNCSNFVSFEEEVTAITGAINPNITFKTSNDDTSV